MLKTLKDASSRCPQKSRRSEVRFALWYASVSKAGDGKSSVRVSLGGHFEGLDGCHTGGIIQGKRRVPRIIEKMDVLGRSTN